MTEKELKKLNRQELLEILLMQSKKIDRLEAQLNAAQQKLENKTLAVSNAGSIAEASLALNDIFGNAQSTADQYLENIRLMQEQMKAECERTEAECEQKKKDAQKEADEYLESMRLMREQTEAECEQLRKDTQKMADQYLENIRLIQEQTEAECERKKRAADLYVRQRGTGLQKEETAPKSDH